MGETLSVGTGASIPAITSVIELQEDVLISGIATFENSITAGTVRLGINFEGRGKIGAGVENPRAVIDVGFATDSYILPPVVTTAERNGIDGGTPEAGAIIFNTSTNKHQGWDGSSWNDFY